jgi:hypothetical protein
MEDILRMKRQHGMPVLTRRGEFPLIGQPSAVLLRFDQLVGSCASASRSSVRRARLRRPLQPHQRTLE